MRPSPKSPWELASTAVYDGRQCVGYLVETASGQVEAFPTTGDSLGRYNNAQAAAHALLVLTRQAVAP